MKSPLFPDKAKMVRSANLLLVIFAVAPGLYLVTALLATFGKPGLARDPNIIPWLFLGLALFSLANIGVTIFVQTSTRLMSERALYDPISRTYLIMSTGAILSEAHSLYGLVLTLLSGSIFYELGFTIITWASLRWVWKRFKQNLPKLPERVDPTGTRFLPCLTHRDSKQSMSFWFCRRDFFVSLLDERHYLFQVLLCFERCDP